MEFNLYTTQDDVNVINKELDNKLSFDIVLKSATDIFNPEIAIQSEIDLTAFNYAEIDYFGRFYFIDKIEPKPNQIYTLYLTCDVLESFKDDILNSEQISNNQSIDVLIDVVESDVDVDEMIRNMDAVSYVLTTLGVDYIDND